MQRLKKENLLRRSDKITRILILLFLLGAMFAVNSCSAPYKGHKKYKSVPCPCENNRRDPHTYY